MTRAIIVDDELWLYKHADGRWHLAVPWITKQGKGMPGAVETSARLRVVNPETEVELRVFVKDCRGCEDLQRASGGETLRLEHTHGPV